MFKGVVVNVNCNIFRVIPSLFFAGFLFLLLAGHAFADTKTVCALGCTYTTIAAAEAGATAGDTINVSTGTYNEATPTFTKQLNWVAIDGNGTVIITNSASGSGLNVARKTGTAVVSITGFVFDGLDDDANVFFFANSAANVTLDYCTFRNAKTYDLYYGTGLSNIVIDHSTIYEPADAVRPMAFYGNIVGVFQNGTIDFYGASRFAQLAADSNFSFLNNDVDIHGMTNASAGLMWYPNGLNVTLISTGNTENITDIGGYYLLANSANVGGVINFNNTTTINKWSGVFFQVSTPGAWDVDFQGSVTATDSTLNKPVFSIGNQPAPSLTNFTVDLSVVDPANTAITVVGISSSGTPVGAAEISNFTIKNPTKGYNVGIGSVTSGAWNNMIDGVNIHDGTIYGYRYYSPSSATGANASINIGYNINATVSRMIEYGSPCVFFLGNGMTYTSGGYFNSVCVGEGLVTSVSAGAKGIKNVPMYNNTVINTSSTNRMAGLYAYANGVDESGGVQLKNNIVYGYSRDIGIDDGAMVNFYAGNNLYHNLINEFTFYWTDIQTDHTWAEWLALGSNFDNIGSLVADPLFIGASDYHLQSTSPAIDAGVDVGFTTDIEGNPIYGTPDIGAYEYQPPYTIGTDEIDTTGSIRIYSDGKYRYKTAPTGGPTADLSVTLSGGWVSDDYSEFMDVSIDTWNISDSYYKKWLESSPNSSMETDHVVGDLRAGESYQVRVGGVVLYTLVANESGKISFTYSGGYSEKVFEVVEMPFAPTLSPSDESTGFLLTSNLSINFAEVVNVGTGNIVIKKASDDSIVETIDVLSGQVTGTGTDTITINPTADFLSETEYYVQIDATAFDDGDGNSFAGISDATSWDFSTGEKLDQTIDVLAITTRSYGGAPFELSCESTSGLPITLTSSNESIITVTGLTATIVAVGTTTITYAQEGNSTYNPAVSVEQIVTVDAVIPTLTTTFMSSITTTSASSGGNITSDGGDSVTARGVCISLLPDPTTSSGDCSTTGTGIGEFTRDFTGLTPSTTYHVRAYATNGIGNAYGSDVEFVTRDLPPVISDVNYANITSDGATITWTTDTASSSQVQYGLSNSFDVSQSTDEVDTETRVTSHSVPLSSLISCTTYYYKVKSIRANSDQSESGVSSFTTGGCTGNAEIIAQTEAEVISSDGGGTVQLINENSTGVTIEIPEGYSDTNNYFQIMQLDNSEVLSETVLPSGYLPIGNYIYEFRALSGVGTEVTNFDENLYITMSYAGVDILTIDENSLRIFYSNGEDWNALDGCVVNTSAHTVTCITNHFSSYGLFGAPPSLGGGVLLPSKIQTSKIQKKEKEKEKDPVVEPIKTTVSECEDLNVNTEEYVYIKNLLSMNNYPVIERNKKNYCRPLDKITRGEFVAWIVSTKYPEKLKEFDKTKVKSVPFSDININYVYAPHVIIARELGIVHGYPDGSFKPKNIINLAELLKILISQYTEFQANESQLSDLKLKSPEKNPMLLFKDIKTESDWYFPYLYYSSSKNIIVGEKAEMSLPIIYAKGAKIFSMILNVDK